MGESGDYLEITKTKAYLAEMLHPPNRSPMTLNTGI